MEIKGKEGTNISSSSDFWTTRQLKDYLRKQGGRLSWRKSALVSRQVIDALNNEWSVDIGRRSMTVESFFSFLFFCLLLSHEAFSSIRISSWERCSYSENQNAAALLLSLRRQTQHCRFPPSMALLNFLASRSPNPKTRNTLPKLCSSLNFCWLWKYRSHFFFLEWWKMTRIIHIEHHFPHFWLMIK